MNSIDENDAKLHGASQILVSLTATLENRG